MLSDSSRREKVVLFGAGASYGAGDTFPEAPPLGKGLYNELARNFPGSWGSFPPEIRTSFQTSFESGMAVLWDRYSQHIPVLMRHMTLYFAQFRPGSSGRNLYVRFFRELFSKKIVSEILHSTLNYELVLELAVSNCGLQIAYGGDTIENGIVAVWKLHGSCNFIPTSIQAGGGVSFTRGVVFDSSLQLHQVTTW